jgi:hypothetical protein
MRAKRIFTGLAVAALLVATGGSPAASAAVDTTGPTIVMQNTGHIVVGAPVTCLSSTPCVFTTPYNYTVFESTGRSVHT